MFDIPGTRCRLPGKRRADERHPGLAFTPAAVETLNIYIKKGKQQISFIFKDVGASVSVRGGLWLASPSGTAPMRRLSLGEGPGRLQQERQK